MLTPVVKGCYGCQARSSYNQDGACKGRKSKLYFTSLLSKYMGNRLCVHLKILRCSYCGSANTDHVAVISCARPRMFTSDRRRDDLSSVEENNKRNKHNAELQQTDPGTKVTGEFSTRGYIITPKFNMPRVLIVKTIHACDGAQPCCSSFTFAIFCEVP